MFIMVHHLSAVLTHVAEVSPKVRGDFSLFHKGHLLVARLGKKWEITLHRPDGRVLWESWGYGVPQPPITFEMVDIAYDIIGKMEQQF